MFQVASLVNIGSNYLNADMEARRYGTAHQSIVPYQVMANEPLSLPMKPLYIYFYFNKMELS